ncbi:MAG: HU family DNA-binding protein [Fusobacteriaceae bacterium]
MTKKELVAKIKTELGIDTTVNSERTVNGLLDVIKDELTKGESVEIFGFGKFEVVTKAAREGRNPKTGETISIEAKKVVKFKASKALSDLVK